MKVIRIHEFGGPEVLKLATRPLPHPKPGEVLIRVAAAGVRVPTPYNFHEGVLLMELVADYVAKRGRKTPVREEARATGAQYGLELAQAGMSLSQAMHAFTFFRRSLDQSAKQALAKAGTPPQESIEVCEQIMALADEVLLGIAESYEV